MGEIRALRRQDEFVDCGGLWVSESRSTVRAGIPDAQAAPMLETQQVVQLGMFDERRRRRELAGDARAGSWARGKARSQQRAFARANWVRYTVVGFLGLVVSLVVAWTMPNNFLAGVVIGTSLVG